MVPNPMCPLAIAAGNGNLSMVCLRGLDGRGVREDCGSGFWAKGPGVRLCIERRKDVSFDEEGRDKGAPLVDSDLSKGEAGNVALCTVGLKV